jgi:prepilin peptidase CpaA
MNGYIPNFLCPAAVCVVVAGAALCTDLRSRRIPNGLTVTAAVSALCYRALCCGFVEGVPFAVKGCMVGLGLFIIPFILGGMGGGDVKLFGAVGAWMGAEAVVCIGLFAAVTGGAMAFCILIRRGGFRRFYCVPGVTAGKLMTVRAGTSSRRDSGRFSYAIPVLCGLTVYCVLRWTGCV